jgi:hypothetical protein
MVFKFLVCLLEVKSNIQFLLASLNYCKLLILKIVPKAHQNVPAFLSPTGRKCSCFLVFHWSEKMFLLPCLSLVGKNVPASLSLTVTKMFLLSCLSLVGKNVPASLSLTGRFSPVYIHGRLS